MAKQSVERPEQTSQQPDYLSVAVSSSGAAAQDSLRNIRLILGREYIYRVKQRSFLITSGILLVIVFLAAFVPTIVQYITAHTASPTRLVVVNEAGSIAGLDEAQLSAFIT